MIIALGGILAFLSGLWFLSIVFQENLLWGLACLAVPGASVLYAVLNWQQVKMPFLTNVSGLILMFLGGASFIS